MRLPFEIDPQIIHHIIHSQAGSVAKAVIELIMNSVDAGARNVHLHIGRTGFECRDDGVGFASREDVVRYFGRFGTPHLEGDAKFGRFRLGRGQIMAHARTDWLSNSWRMEVDTKEMGHSYELTESAKAAPGCSITGNWYEHLTDEELQSTLQELRDLVRYTPVLVHLNERQLTRDPLAEPWDHEDEFAYYRLRREGHVSIYNQGVLVRHDPGGMWGSGGIIVSKPAFALNVSRSEVLRKTCPVWKRVAERFGAMASEMSATQGSHRKTEDSRSRAASRLLSNDPNLGEIFHSEEVITLLPGAKHITLERFLARGHNENTAACVVDGHRHVPRAERLARANIAMMIHPKTLDRFNCFTPEEFIECLETILAFARERKLRYRYTLPRFASLQVLMDNFIERTAVLPEATLGKEERRYWTAMRWCLESYAAVCTGRRVYRNGRAEQLPFQVLMGESNVADAWTNGSDYIAINVELVKALSKNPLQTASRLFSLVEHEVAHQGDSLDCGHDEAFYQRFHDISIAMSEQRQRYLHTWVRKVTTSMESEGKKAAGSAWSERYLLDRAGNGRSSRGLGPMVDLPSNEETMGFVPSQIPEGHLDRINVSLVESGNCPVPPDWTNILQRAVEAQARDSKQFAEDYPDRLPPSATKGGSYGGGRRADAFNLDGMSVEDKEAFLKERRRISEVTQIQEDQISMFDVEMCFGMSDDNLREFLGNLRDVPSDFDDSPDFRPSDLLESMNADLRALVRPGETSWSLERNAAAAGFYTVFDYLRWRDGGGLPN